MPVVKHYYVIYKIIPDACCVDASGTRLVECKQILCIVEDRDIAEDFCEKHSEYMYSDETINENLYPW